MRLGGDAQLGGKILGRRDVVQHHVRSGNYIRSLRQNSDTGNGLIVRIISASSGDGQRGDEPSTHCEACEQCRIDATQNRIRALLNLVFDGKLHCPDFISGNKGIFEAEEEIGDGLGWPFIQSGVAERLRGLQGMKCGVIHTTSIACTG